MKQFIRWKWLVILLLCAGTFLAVPLADWLYAGMVERRYQAWVKDATWNEAGFLAGCEEVRVRRGGTAVLFVHGFASCPAVFRRVLPVFTDEGYSAHAIRLAGCAEREGQAGSRRLLDLWREKLDGELESMRKRYDRVWIAGHSMGGALAIDAVFRHPGQAEGLLLFAPLLGVSTAQSPLISPQAWYRMARPFMRRTKRLENVLPLDAVDPALQDSVIRDRFIGLDVYDALFELLHELHASGKVLDAPVFLAVASKDKVVDTASACDYVAAKVQGSLHIMEAMHSGHVITEDRDWQDVAREALAFMEPLKDMAPESVEMRAASEER